jgi:hypothetical protein
LIIAQMTITGQFILKEARHHEAYATIALMFMTYFFLRSTRARYDPASSALPLEVATVMDISLQQEGVAMRQAESARIPQHQDGGASRHAASAAPTESDHVGTGEYIGKYDPFRKTYLQPALRANPRARPEQPFPVAQLGRPEAFFGTVEGTSESTDSDLQDSNAIVRLKSMNQHDRRLVNRWWNDQLQRCGDPNLFSILIGEECGTLALSSTNNGDEELQEQQTMASTHSFV